MNGCNDGLEILNSQILVLNIHCPLGCVVQPSINCQKKNHKLHICVILGPLGCPKWISGLASQKKKHFYISTRHGGINRDIQNGCLLSIFALVKPSTSCFKAAIFCFVYGNLLVPQDSFVISHSMVIQEDLSTRNQHYIHGKTCFMGTNRSNN